MPIDVMHDKLMHIEAVAARFPRKGGKPTNVATVRRWIERGFKGIVLEAAPVGSSYYTTEKAVEEFCRRLAERKRVPVACARKTRKRQCERDAEWLAARGFQPQGFPAPDGDSEAIAATGAIKEGGVNGSGSHEESR